MTTYDNTKNIDKIISAIFRSKKSLRVLYCVVAAVAFALVCERTNPEPYSLKNVFEFSLVMLIINLFILFYTQKIGTATQVRCVEKAMHNLLIGDWSFPFFRIAFIPKMLFKHPVFVCLIGLYACKYDRKEQGLALIELAEHQMPIIGSAVKNGLIIDRQIFEALKQQIVRDVYPVAFMKIYNIIVFIIGIISLLLLLMIVAYLLLHFVL